MQDVILPSKGQFLREDAIRGGMDLLFFAHTRHLKHADEALAAVKLGRAHHRVLYFLARRPGIAVSALLAILGVTKQSFGRVSSELAAKGLIEHHPGEEDRRQRMYQLTSAGIKLEAELFAILHANVLRAYTASGGIAVAGFWTVLQHLIGEEGNMQFRVVQGL